MPLSAFFEDQVDEIRGFLEDPGRVLQIIQVDSELRVILLKMLAGLDEEDEFPHLLIGHDGRFSDPVQWFADLQNALEARAVRRSQMSEKLIVVPVGESGEFWNERPSGSRERKLLIAAIGRIGRARD